MPFPVNAVKENKEFQTQPTIRLSKSLAGRPSVVLKLRTFALIVSAHPYCPRKSTCTSCIERAREVLKWTIIGQMAIAIALTGFSGLGCSVLMHHFLFSMFSAKKMKEIYWLELWIFEKCTSNSHLVSSLLICAAVSMPFTTDAHKNFGLLFRPHHKRRQWGTMAKWFRCWTYNLGVQGWSLALSTNWRCFTCQTWGHLLGNACK